MDKEKVKKKLANIKLTIIMGKMDRSVNGHRFPEWIKKKEIFSFQIFEYTVLSVTFITRQLFTVV